MSKTSSLGDCGMNMMSLLSLGCGCGGVRGELVVEVAKACCSLSPLLCLVARCLFVCLFFFFF